MKEIFCLLLLTTSCYSAICQRNHARYGSGPNVEYVHKSINTLIRKFKKTDCYIESDSLGYLFIYTMGFKERPSRRLFLEDGLMNSLYFMYRRKFKMPLYDIIYITKIERLSALLISGMYIVIIISHLIILYIKLRII